MKHIALFSQTGSEIGRLIDLGIQPDLVFYDQTNPDIIDHSIDTESYAFRIPKKKVKDVKFLRDCFGDPGKCYITLHGWLHILPKEICKEYEVYNGHPGYIIKYPELKGKDPQKRAFQDREKYKFIGSVIHKVIPEVDEGEVLYESCLLNAYTSEEGVIDACKRISLDIWKQFFTERIK
jgi:folate-dependent phosphoribosylglycinamide formyltransferase PurN